VAGFCVGIVERAQLLDGSRVRAGDIVIGLASSGVHANGFSLIRQALSGTMVRRLGRRLMTPTRIYVRPLLRLLRRVSVSAVVHVTGGGLTRRLPTLAVAHRSLRVHLRPGSWPMPGLFRMIQRAGGLPTEEMLATFNMGIGMALACRPGDAAAVVRWLRRDGVRAWPIGSIERV
jgi:phosphoribosylformylglycinamidine cyclo-ligase